MLLLCNALFGGDILHSLPTLDLPLPRKLMKYAAALKHQGIDCKTYDTIIVSMEQFQQYLFVHRFDRVAILTDQYSKQQIIDLVNYIKQTPELKNTSIVLIGNHLKKDYSIWFDQGIAVILWDEKESVFVDLVKLLQNPFNPFLDQAKGIAFRNVLGQIVEQPAGELIPSQSVPDYDEISHEKYRPQSKRYEILLDISPDLTIRWNESVLEKIHIEKKYGWKVCMRVFSLRELLEKIPFLPSGQTNLIERIIVSPFDASLVNGLSELGCKELMIRINDADLDKWIRSVPLSQQIFHFESSLDYLEIEIVITENISIAQTIKDVKVWSEQLPPVSFIFKIEDTFMLKVITEGKKKQIRQFRNLFTHIQNLSNYMYHVKIALNQKGRWKNWNPKYHYHKFMASYLSWKLPN
jgi:hypothetical protein